MLKQGDKITVGGNRYVFLMMDFDPIPGTIKCNYCALNDICKKRCEPICTTYGVVEEKGIFSFVVSESIYQEGAVIRDVSRNIIAQKQNMETKNTTFKEIADRIVALQEKKNRSYGNAFEQSCDKYGIVSALTRLNDKMNRLDALHKASEDEAFGESFTDTLTDLAAYAIMTIEYIENKKNTLTNSE